MRLLKGSACASPAWRTDEPSKTPIHAASAIRAMSFMLPPRAAACRTFLVRDRSIAPIVCAMRLPEQAGGALAQQARGVNLSSVRPRPRDAAHLARTGRSQRLRACVERRAGRDDIIDQQHARCIDVLAVRRERAAHDRRALLAMHRL